MLSYLYPCKVLFTAVTSGSPVYDLGLGQPATGRYFRRRDRKESPCVGGRQSEFVVLKNRGCFAAAPRRPAEEKSGGLASSCPSPSIQHIPIRTRTLVLVPPSHFGPGSSTSRRITRPPSELRVFLRIHRNKRNGDDPLTPQRIPR